MTIVTRLWCEIITTWYHRFIWYHTYHHTIKQHQYHHYARRSCDIMISSLRWGYSIITDIIGDFIIFNYHHYSYISSYEVWYVWYDTWLSPWYDITHMMLYQDNKHHHVRWYHHYDLISSLPRGWTVPPRLEPKWQDAHVSFCPASWGYDDIVVQRQETPWPFARWTTTWLWGMRREDLTFRNASDNLALWNARGWPGLSQSGRRSGFLQ